MIQIGEYEVSLEEFIEAVKVSTSYIDTLRSLNIDHNNNRANKVRDIIKENQIDTSHFSRIQVAKPERVESIKEAVKVSISIREALMRLGLAPLGGNYACIKKIIKEYDIDTSHFLGAASNKGKTFPELTKKSSDYAGENAPTISSSRLKEKLIKEGVFERKCYNCNNTEWLGKPIPLELEHKDGNHQHNEHENLTLLCPNCHAFTETYRRRKS